MPDELDILRSFRADHGGPDAATLTRIRTAVAERTTAAEPHSTDTPPLDAPVTPLAVDGLPDTPYVSNPDERSRRRHGWPPLVAAAAALLLFAGVVTWSATRGETTGDGVADSSTPSPPLIPLAPDPVPSGLVLRHADVPPAVVTAEPEPIGAFTVYLPEGDADPFAPRGVAITSTGAVDQSSDLAEPDPDRGIRVDVGEGVGHLRDADGMAFLDLELDGQRYLVVGRGVDAALVVEVAASAHLDPRLGAVLDETRLPAGWTRRSTIVPSPDGGGVVYSDSDEPLAPAVTISWEPLSDGHLEGVRFLLDESASGCDDDCPTVDGRPIVAGRTVFALLEEADVLHVAWETDDRVVSISTGSLALDEVVELAESLQATTWEELEAAVVPYDTSSGPTTTQP